MAPGDVIQAENARIARFLVQLEEMELRRQNQLKARPAQLAWLARHDTTESSRRTHNGRTISAEPSSALMAEEEHLRTLRFAPGAVSQRMSTSGGATALLADAPPVPKSPARLAPIRAGSGDFGSRLSPKGPKRQPARPEPASPSPATATPKPKARPSKSPVPRPKPVKVPERGSSPNTLSRPRAEPEPEPELRPSPKKGTTGMPGGEDLGLPPGVSADFLQPFYRSTFPDMDPVRMRNWIRRYSQCGIFTTVQLLHAMKTRAVSKTMPPESFWRGRAFLVNELIETCSDSMFLSGAESDALIQAITARPVRPTGPELGAAEGLSVMEPSLQLALAATGRLDLRPMLVQLGILGLESLQAATEGCASREVSLLQLPINAALQQAGEKSLGFELIDALLAECTGQLPAPVSLGVGKPALKSKPEPELAPHCQRTGEMRCWMYGKEGHGFDGQWAMMKKEETTLPGSRKNAANLLQSQRKTPEEPADVILMRGDMPLVICVPHGGLKGSSAGSAKSFKQWADWTTSRTPHSVQIIPEPRGTLGFKAGARICNAEGTVRAVVSQDVDFEVATEIVYLLESSSPSDFSPHDHIFTANVMWKRAATMSMDEAVFKVGPEPPKVASVHASTSPVLELAEAVREACWMSSCLTPYVVLCNLEPSKVDVAAPLTETIPEKPPPPGQRDMRHRASAAWHNYHACIEIAKQEVAKMSCTGGDALVVELLVEGHVQDPAVSIGYGLREFEVDIVSRPPGQAVKRTIDRATLLKTFFAFDADGSGAVDAEELQAAATKFGLPMSDADVEEAMAGLGKGMDEEINKKEFISWFEGLSKPTPGSANGVSKMELIQKNATAAASSIGYLSRRLGEGRPPADAFIGDYSIGTMMSSMGCPTTPSAEHPLPSKLLRPMAGTDYEYQSGTYTVEIHGSSDFSGRCDCVNVSLPASIWAKSTDPAEVEKDLRDAFSMVDVDGSGEIDSTELKGLAKMLGMQMSDKDIQQAMDEMDEDGSGEVTHYHPLLPTTLLPASHYTATSL
jgi:Ca2+-binding EF-hand superfamily protein